MEKKNNIIFIIILIITLVLVGVCIYFVLNNNKRINEDARKFREEYMVLNNKLNELTNTNYSDVFISEDNTVKYVNAEDAIKILEKGSGYIYFGYAECAECRLFVPVLTEVFSKKNIEINYLDVQNIRSSFVLKDGTISKIKDGTKEYYKILKLLDKELEDLYLIDEAGNMYDTKEKNFFVPILVAVSSGKVSGIHVGSVSNDPNSLTNEEKTNLENILNKIINDKEIEDSTCSNDKVC